MTVPTYSAAVNFSNDLTGYFRIDSGVLDTDKLGGEFADAGFVTIDTRVRALRCRRGREDELAGITAGTVECVCDDTDGALDPENGTSPYAPNVKLLRRLKATATYGGTVYPLGYGFLDGYQAAPEAVRADVTLHATDLFKRLTTRRITATFAQQATGARIAAVLDLIQWPADMRDLDTGQSTTPAVTLASKAPIEHLNAVVTAEQGTFWIAASGKATFRDRHRRLTATSRGSFGAGGGSGLHVQAVRPSYNDAGIYNRVRCKRSAGTEQLAEDAASQAAYDVREYSVAQEVADALLTDTDANALANWILYQRKEPVARIERVDLDPHANDALWPHVLGAEVGERLTLTHNLPGTSGLSADFFIESITHDVAMEGPVHQATWGLSRVPLATWFLVGDASSGQVGVGQIAY